MSKNEIFTIRARLCKRCGRIVTSRKSVKLGYGHTCLQKTLAEKESSSNIDGQLSLYKR